jgi:hypothetical protein
MKSLFLILFLVPFALYAQQGMEKNLDTAFQNAKKGVYWALANIPENKSRLRSELIADEKLYASVRLEKEYEGVKILSTGYYNSTEISITLYRSNEGLIEEGYIRTAAPPDSSRYE